jgi:hypothetical protein
MGYEPILDGSPQTNVYSEHVFKIRCTFGASSAVTFRSKDATIAKTTTTTFTVTLPKAYAEITSLSQGWKKATGADSLQLEITTDSVATDGTLVFTSKSTNSAGTATAPADGDVVYLTIGVSCDVLNDRFTG